MCDKIKIRLLQLSDFEQIWLLWNSVPGVGLRQWDDSEAGIGAFLKRNPTTCFVAERNGSILGCMLSGNDGRRGFIYHATVRTDMHYHGIGKAMLTEVLRSLKIEGIKKVNLVCFIENDKAQEFWQSQGFSFRRDLTYMEKEI